MPDPPVRLVPDPDHLPADEAEALAEALQGEPSERDLTTSVDSRGETPAPLSPRSPRVGIGVVSPPPTVGGGRHRAKARATWPVVAGLVVAAGLGGAYTGATLASSGPTSAYTGVPGQVVPLGEVPERGAISAWEPEAPELSIPLLSIQAKVGRGTDAGPGPVVLPGTVWPGEAGRSVVMVWADLEPLRAGDPVAIGATQWVVTHSETVGEGDLARLTAQPTEGQALVLVEATTGFREPGSPRIAVHAWRTP